MSVRMVFARARLHGGSWAESVRRGIASSAIQQEAKAAEVSSTKQKPKEKTPVSSATKGSILRGLNIYKEGQDPVALKDEEYPAWLWTLLDKTPVEDMGEIERQRIERSKAIKTANFMKSKK
ncbi:hypothetical protein GGF46_001616 [Coemansia sp. RSA 552]|nr:hypothetical protein GGF46_001616 [Coemansia sp. RSA 552]